MIKNTDEEIKKKYEKYIYVCTNMMVIKYTPVIVIIELSKDGVAIFLCVINVSFLWVFL